MIKPFAYEMSGIKELELDDLEALEEVFDGNPAFNSAILKLHQAVSEALYRSLRATTKDEERVRGKLDMIDAVVNLPATVKNERKRREKKTA